MLLTRFTVVFCCEAYLAFSFVDAATAVFLFKEKKISLWSRDSLNSYCSYPKIMVQSFRKFTYWPYF